MVTEHGDVVWVDFGHLRGSEPVKIRPTVVLQENWRLATEVNTVLVAPVTSNVSQETFPGNVLVPAGVSGLEMDSVALVTKLGPVSREFVEPHALGHLSAYVLGKIGAGLRLVTGV